MYTWDVSCIDVHYPQAVICTDQTVICSPAAWDNI